MPAVGDQHRGNPASIMMPNSTGAITANPFEEPQRRINEYTAQEIATLQARLDKKLGPEYISSRPGAAGQRVHYLSADKCINLANEVFGFNGWSSSIQNIQIDFVEESPNTGKISLGLSVIVRVTLKDGTYHEDIGYGHIENCKGKAAAFEKAKKEGTTDALKRALRNFGNVLGNCVYDKDYVSKVTKVKTVPAKWDVDELHRHPDFVPRKEPVKPKPSPEDDDLPPRPTDVGKSSSIDDSMAFDGDGEFGSDLFDEADFGVGGTGNPDEVVLGPETQKQPPTPLNGPNVPRQPFNNNARAPMRPNPAMVTPSKPERPFNPAPGGAVPIKREFGASTINEPPRPQDTLPGTPSASFFSARAVDLLRDNPNGIPSGAPVFDPHAESPSIRKTAGIDHNKSLPVSRPMLAGAGAASPATNNTRDFVNPSQDMNRRIGAPGMNSPMNRPMSTSSYRPLTRPNINAPGAAAAANRATTPGLAPQNVNGKRPPLSDVTNASNPSGGSGPAPPGVSENDPKRPKV
ncbi:Aspartic-type endopeptidase ctsD [Aspergillus niger]|uniref:RAD52 homolog n=1 Tax=Aspergillus niger TaxID=5061 RepID=A0A505HWF3_ASPNG|nr:Aspartic-type endopeptidase ctsD [Aspergillus niger]